jgi:RES domain-containing protein
LTLSGWRLVREPWAARAFDGEGARLYGGRWNSPGVRMAYAAEHLSLAVLEVLVHLQGGAQLDGFCACRVDFDSRMVEPLDRARLPEGWRRYPAPSLLQGMGDHWTAAGRRPILKVPSAIVDIEHLYLINPAHPAFGRMVPALPQAFRIDARLA